MSDGTDQHDGGPLYTGDEAEKRCLLCVQCERYVELDRDGQPLCEHDDETARTVGHLTGAEWANIRLRANKRELDREDGPRGNEAVLQSNVLSLVSDLAMAGELEDPPEDLQ